MEIWPLLICLVPNCGSPIHRLGSTAAEPDLQKLNFLPFVYNQAKLEPSTYTYSRRGIFDILHWRSFDWVSIFISTLWTRKFAIYFVIFLHHWWFERRKKPRISIIALSQVLPLRELKTQKTRIDFLISSLTTYICKAILLVFFFTTSTPGRISALYFLKNNGSWRMFYS